MGRKKQHKANQPQPHHRGAAFGLGPDRPTAHQPSDPTVGNPTPDPVIGYPSPDPQHVLQKRIVTAIMGLAPSAGTHQNRVAEALIADLTIQYPQAKALHDRAWREIINTLFIKTWEKGWLPVDVYHLAVKKLPRDSHDYYAYYLGEHFAQFPPSSVHPRILAQVHGLQKNAKPITFLHIDLLAELMARINELHGLALILPLPGQYTPTDADATTADVDLRMLEKVRALLAKAESTEFEAEADTFTAGAQRLMAKHSIDAALLAATEPQQHRRGAETWRIHVEKPYDSQKSLLLGQIANANRCQAVWSPSVGIMAVVGFATDVRAVETLFTSLLVQANTAMLREGTKQHRDGSSRTRSFRNTFLQAFAIRIGERLSETTTAETEAAAHAATNLLPVLAERAEAVAEELRRIAPNIKQRRIRVANDAEGWHSGSTAADLASLAPGAPINQ